MKKILYILLSFISIQATAQIEQPRIKLNQVIKDTLSGRFVMSSLIDSSLTYESVLTTDGNLLYLKNQPYVSGGVNSIEYIFEASSNISQGQAVAINTDGKVSSVVTSDRTVITDSDLDLFMLSKNIPSTANHIINLSTAYKYTSLDWTNKMINISGRLGIVARNPDTVGYLNILDFDGALENSNLITSSLTKDELTQYGLVSRETERNISIIPLDTVNNPSTSYTNNKWLALYKNGVGRTYTQLNKNSSNGWPAFSGIEYPILQYVTINNSPSVVVTHFTSGGSSFGSKYPTYHVNIHKLNNNKLIATLFEANNIESEESVRVVQGTIISNTVSDSIHWDSYYDYPNSEPHPYIDIENMNPSRGHSVYVPDENKVTIVSVVETGSLVDVVANIVAKTVYIQADTLVQTNLDTLLEIYSFNNLNINVGSFKDKIVVVKSTVGNPALAEYFQDFYVFTLNNGVITAPTNYTRVGPYTASSKNVQMVYDYQINKLIVGIDNGLFAGTYNATTGTLIFGPTTFTDYNIDEITFNYNKDNSDYTRIAVLHADEKKIGLYDVSLSNIYNFIGFSKDNIPAGSLGTVTLLGGVNTYQDSLSPGRSYYINTEGNLQLDYSISGVVGKALTDTSILVTYIGVGNPNYIDENINIVDINPITNILTNETTPLTANRTTNTTTLDITEATSTTDGYITSEYKVQLDNLLSNSYLDTIRTDNTLTYTEITTDSVLLTVDTTVIATVNYVNANAGLWIDTANIVELKNPLPIQIPFEYTTNIDLADWDTTYFTGGIPVTSTTQERSGVLYYDHNSSLTVSYAPPNTGFKGNIAGSIKYVAPKRIGALNWYDDGYEVLTLTPKWYVDDKITEAISGAKYSIFNTDLQQGTGIIISPSTYSATISVDTTLIATQAYVDANAGGSVNNEVVQSVVDSAVSILNGGAMFQQIFTSDGLTDTFTITENDGFVPASTKDILVADNGQILDKEFITLDSNKVILSYTPVANHRIAVIWFSTIANGGQNIQEGTGVRQEIFTADGIDSSYVITINNGILPTSEENIVVIQNGIMLDKDLFTKTAINTIELSFLPNAGDRITVMFFTGGGDVVTANTLTVSDSLFVTGKMVVDTNTLFVDADSNRVGIGISTPTVPLDVNGNIRIRGGGTSSNLYFNSDGSANNYGAIEINNDVANGTSMRFYNWTNQTLTEKMRITSTGNVGIGTTTPGSKFHVYDAQSSIALRDYNNGATIFLDGSDGDFTGGDYFHIRADGHVYLGLGGYGGGTTPLNITNAGNVGIGTTSPTVKLDVAGNTAMAGTFFMRGNISVQKGGSYNNSRTVEIQVDGSDQPRIYSSYWTTASSLRIGTYSSKDAITIEPNGNVGIGDVSPSQALDVIGNIYYTGTITDVSDERLKINKTPLTNSLDKIMQLTPITYQQVLLENGDIGDVEYGLTAQDVQNVFPDMVDVFEVKDNIEYLGLSYTQLIAPTIKAIQELNNKVDTLEAQVQILINEINNLKNQ